ncbi:hypothetical protein E2C01_101113 [Portunus trituberculatus]|uniref:Uncharacterized protein n=1 Tax=Portunus trituberculatus TaxID=210409 RepID=A0A5B7K9T3_PORTR|nr:hypothetical protein [Portunus trituberculatus]
MTGRVTLKERVEDIGKEEEEEEEEKERPDTTRPQPPHYYCSHTTTATTPPLRQHHVWTHTPLMTAPFDPLLHYKSTSTSGLKAPW